MGPVDNTVMALLKNQVNDSDSDNLYFHFNEIVVDTYFDKEKEKFLYMNFLEIDPFSYKDCVPQGSFDFSVLRNHLPDAQNNEEVVKLFEDVTILFYSLYKSQSNDVRAMSVLNFVKLRSGKSILYQCNLGFILERVQEIFSQNELQGGFSFETLSDFLASYTELRESPFFKKILRLVTFAISLNLLSSAGKEFCSKIFSGLEEETQRINNCSKMDLLHLIAETITFLLKRGYQCLISGSMQPMYHSEEGYVEWYNKLSEIKVRAMGYIHEDENPKDVTFLGDLDKLIEQGESMYQHASRIGSFERKKMRALLDDCKLVKAQFLTAKFASTMRRAPFGLLIFGSSGIGKSTITKMLFTYFGKLYNKPVSDEYFYPHCGANKFWDNFTTDKWCIGMDDIAFLKPGVAQGGDPSLLEIIQVMNPMPYTPDQAKLENKGKTPCRADLVLASTNVFDLNAFHYFSCPSAVQRRFPYIVEPIVKPEYATSGMLDHSKVPQDNGFPDLWTYNLYKVTPVREKKKMKEMASVVKTHTGLNQKEFLLWFKDVTVSHREGQEKVVESAKDMKNVEITDCCGLPQYLCDCNIAECCGQSWNLCNCVEVPQGLTQTYVKVVRWTMGIFLCQWWFQTFLRSVIFFDLPMYMYSSVIWRPFARIYDRMLLLILSPITHPSLYVRVLGRIVEHLYPRKSWHVNIIVRLSNFLIYWYAIRTIMGFFTKTVEEDEDTVQGPVCSKASECERDNVWYSDDFTLSIMDVSPVTIAWNGMQPSEVVSRIGENCAVFHFDNNKCIRAICLKEHVWCFPLHIWDDSITEVQIIRGVKQGVSRNLTVALCTHDIQKLVEHDLAVVTIRRLPPCRDISSLFIKENVNVRMNGTIPIRQMDGSLKSIDVSALRFLEGQEHSSFSEKFNLWAGFPTEFTSHGDCGSPYIGFSARGPVILGFHVFCNSKTVSCRAINSTIINKCVQGTSIREVLYHNEDDLQGLSSLHRKANVRYIRDGSCDVFGTFAGFRCTPRSFVEPTPIQERMVRECDFPVNYTKPIMSGWKPWNLALEQMSKPCNKFPMYMIKYVSEGFLNDIVNNMESKWLEFVHPIDLFEAINGAEGIVFVDKVNCNTSAGFPWRKCKKFFREELLPQRGLSEPFTFSPEIVDRVANLIDQYSRGFCCKPVFVASLKDEPVTFAKRDLGKTRVFAGAPIDFVIVVRMYYLSLVRIIQHNKFLFESCPGTVCQSHEWTNIRDFITQFGEDRMVAGDYKNFDKNMSSDCILAAFEVLIGVARFSGNYTDEDLKIMWGIANDIAFPTMDFNGSLMTFYGSNPSGHPLTVIINGIVNALYIRSAYVVSTGLSVTTFRKNVALITYGDDNVMGVRRGINFDHTKIQSILDNFGITYTMADKTSASVPYIHINEVSFLKRTWVWSDEIKGYLCPLEFDSIQKMLTTWVRSKTICKEEQICAIVSSAIRECFFYGEEVFDKYSDKLRNILFSDPSLVAWIEPYVFPSYNSLLEQYKESSINMKLVPKEFYDFESSSPQGGEVNYSLDPIITSRYTLFQSQNNQDIFRLTSRHLDFDIFYIDSGRGFVCLLDVIIFNRVMVSHLPRCECVLCDHSDIMFYGKLCIDLPSRIGNYINMRKILMNNLQLHHYIKYSDLNCLQGGETHYVTLSQGRNSDTYEVSPRKKFLASISLLLIFAYFIVRLCRV